MTPARVFAVVFDRFARWPRLRRWLIVAVALALLAALSALLRGPVAERLWPASEAEALQHRAETALRAGRLSAPDGSGARELYEAALAIDPDRAELHAGLARVAQAALAQAAAATARGDVATAHARLTLASALSAPRAQVDAAADALRQREAAGAGLDALLAQADAAREAGHLDDGDAAALPLYRRILQLQPQHLRALEGRDDALSALLRQAHAALRRGDMRAAASMLDSAMRYDPGHPDLPDLQARLHHEAGEARQRFERELHAERLDRAADALHRWHDTGVDAEAANAALERLVQAHAQRARAEAMAGRPDRADATLAAADALRPHAQAVRETRAWLHRQRRGPAAAEFTLSTPERRRRVASLLADAQVAEQRGDWLTPPGESAFDKLRAARALAPDDAQVRRAADSVLAHARDCFEHALRDNALQRARVCLDAYAALDGEARGSRAAATRLASRWLAVGEERLRNGELDSARAALDAARTLDRHVEGLRDFDTRLRTAEAAR